MKTQMFWRTLAACLAASVLTVTGVPAQAQDTLHISLRDAAVRAAADNPVLHASHRDVEASEKQLSKAWREYVPTITANARYNYLNDDIALGIPTITLPLPPKGLSLTLDPIHLLDRSTLRADITATVPLFTGLRIESGIRAARHLTYEANAQDTLALQRCTAEALVTYLQCLLAEQNTLAREEAAATVAHHHRDVESLRVQGIATQYDLIRADLAAADADRALEEARNQRTLAYRMLRKVLAVSADVPVVLTDSLAYRECPIQLDDALAEAQSARPEKAVLREKQEVVRALSSVEVGKMLPQIGAFAKYELSEKALTPLDPRWIVGISASVTIFDGLKDLAGAQYYDIQDEKLDDLQQEAGNAISLEVRKNFSDLQTSAANIRSAQTSVALSREALRMANRRFETGAGTSLEVIDAQTTVVASRTGLAAALFAYRSSYVQLVRAMGRTADLLNGAL
jgi:outer membrane protein TolC